MGILITGDSGIGKSEVALSLVKQGHKLIADDIVELSRNDNDELVGRCPPPLQDFLEVRGLGLLDIRRLFSDDSIAARKPLELIVRIHILDAEELRKIDRIHGLYTTQTILGVDVPEVTIPVVTGRNLAILIEAAVKNQRLRKSGYDPVKVFLDRQKHDS